MLPNQVRHRVDAIWDRIWASGISNPLTAIEYFSTVLLLRRLADGGEARGSEAHASTWQTLTEHIADGDAESVAALMQGVQKKFAIGASPEIASSATWKDLSTLHSVIKDVRELDITDRNYDILGDLFEYMLNHLSTAGHFGQFRTPRHIINFLVEVVDPKSEEVVVDPAAGTAGFLIAAHQHRGRGQDEPYVGNEVDASIARVAQTNLLLHGMARGSINHGDSLLCRDVDADVILANPPFAGTVVEDRVADFQSGTLKTELLFIELMMRRLKPEGRAGIVVPTGVLTSTASAAVWIRRQLVDHNCLRTVIELPSGVFRPYTDVRTALLIWSNAPAKEAIDLVRVENDGYSLDDRRAPILSNDLPSALAFLRGEQSSIPHASVKRTEIAQQSFNLSPSRYIRASGTDYSGLGGISIHQSIATSRKALEALASELDYLEGLLK